MKLLLRFKLFYATFYHLFRYILPTWLDNRVFVPLFGSLLYRRSQKALTIKEPRLRFDGAVRDYGYFIRCGEVTMNFDLCGVRSGTRKRRKAYECWHFDEGFMRVGGMVSRYREQALPLADLNNWTSAQEQAVPAADVVHHEPVLLVSNYHKWNPAIILRMMHAYLHTMEACGIRPADTALLLFHNDPEEKLDALGARLFKVQDARTMHGVHLFHNAFYLFQDSIPGWQSRAGVETMRRHLLPAFGITPRRRSEDLKRITLVSRRDYEVNWGLNLAERKISNESEIIEVLRRHFPDAEVHAVQLEQLSVTEQLRLIHDTDVLIGMHGAALGFSALLPENAGLIELCPAHFLKAHWFMVFYLLAVGGGVHYRRWINFRPGREHCSREHAQEIKRRGDWSGVQRDFTEVPPQAVLRRVRSVRRAMLRAARG